MDYVFVDEFYRPKRPPPERHSPPMLMVPQKLFSKTVAIALPRYPKKLPPRRNVSLQAMLFIGWGVADSPPRPTQHKRNALFSCLVASGCDRTKYWRHAGDLEIHRCCGVADFLGRVFEYFSGETWIISVCEFDSVQLDRADWESYLSE